MHCLARVARLSYEKLQRSHPPGNPLARLTTLGVAGTLLLFGCQAAPPPPPTSTPSKPVAPAVSPAASPSPSPSPSPAALVSPSPSPSPAAAARVITIEASDYAFNLPDTFPGGVVTVRLRNIGNEPHHAQFLRLNPNVSLDQVMAALAQPDPGPLFQVVSLEGGPATIEPNGSSEVTLDLKEGQYVLACFVEGPDRLPHIAKGMVRPFQVTAAPPGPAAALPSPLATVTMKDFAFDMPATVPVGRSTLRVVNEGPQGHEISVVRLGAGRTMADLTQFFATPPTAPPSAPPPFAFAGGMQALTKDFSGFTTLELQPGEYAAICLVPDPASGRPHTQFGMIKSFTVR